MDIKNERNVIEMNSEKAFSGYSALSQVEAYWEALRGTRLMPKRSEIDPRGIENALGNTFVLERSAIGVARLRIAGSHLSDIMGMDVRGMPISAFITPEHRAQMADLVEEVFQSPSVCELRLSAAKSRAKPLMDARMLLMPLKSDLGDVSRILGCFVTRGDIGRQPRRFDIIGTKSRPILHPLSGLASPENPQEIDLEKQAQVSGFYEQKIDFKAQAPNPKAPYLRLVKDS